MSDWDPSLYLRFEAQRTQPAIDLANRLRPFAPRSVADLGCGPGNSTAVLRDIFPDAALLRVDSSAAMIQAARERYPGLSFRQCDLTRLEGQFDALFSNACLQWVPGHRALIPSLMDKLKSGGALAVQIPVNGDEPLLRAVHELAAEPEWGLDGVAAQPNHALPTEEYYDILSACARRFDLWQTVYIHALPDHAALIDWVRSTHLRPYLNALDAEAAGRFLKELQRRVATRYAAQRDGCVLLRFRRLFFVAVR